MSLQVEGGQNNVGLRKDYGLQRNKFSCGLDDLVLKGKRDKIQVYLIETQFS